MLNIIEKYIQKLTKEDIILFTFKNNIILKEEETDYIYKIIKEDYKILLSDNYQSVFMKANNYLEKETIKKLYNLFLNYREKYQNYFN